MYRCRNCRQNLKVQDSVIKEIPYCTGKSTSDLSVLYLEIDTCPRWIVQSFEQDQWRKGKLLCVKCKRKLGSFDFIQKRVCQCLQHPVPVVHLLRDRIDEAEKRHDIYISGASIVPQHIQMKRPNASELLVRNKGKEIVSSSSTSNEDLDAKANILTKTGRELPPVDDQVDEIQTNSVHSDESNCNVTLFEPDDNKHGGQGNLPEQNVDLHGSDNNLPEIQGNLLDNSLDFPEYVNVLNNRYAVLDMEEPEELEDDNGQGTEQDRHRSQTKKRKYEGTKENRVEEEHDIEVDLTCSICLELYYSPHRCDPCKHTFCEECLRQVCKQTPTLTRCPLCRNVIRKCVFDKDLTKLIQEKHGGLYKQRGRGPHRKNKSYPLPGATRRQIMMSQQGPSSAAVNSTLMWIILSSTREIFVRFAGLFVIFVVHNILFKLDDILNLDVYAPFTVKLNSYLLKLFGKLIFFGIVYVVKKALRIMIDSSIGYMVSFVFIFSVLIDGNSWLNSLLNLFVLGSLFL